MMLVDKVFAVFCGLSLCFVLLPGCAKPTDAESLQASSGGYAIVGRLHMPGFAQDVVVRDSVAYLVQGEGGLAVISVADVTKPKLLSTCVEGVRGYSYKLALNDSVVYVAAAAFGVNVVNVRDPYSPFAVASNLAIKPAKSFRLFGTYLFTAISESGIKIADVSIPTQPDIRGGIQNPGYAIGMTTTSDSAYLVVACGEMGCALFDIRDMQGGFGSYRQVGWTDTPGYAVDVVLMNNRPIAFLACGTGGVQVVDFSDTTNIRVIGSFATGGYAKEILYSNNRVFVTTELRGVQILAVENPAAPTLVGVVKTEYAMGIALGQRHLYVADEREGLLVIAMP
jgi:hypothetical protein